MLKSMFNNCSLKTTISNFVKRKSVKLAFVITLALLTAASIPLWVNAAFALPYAFRQEASISKLPNPVDFSQVVYAESDKSVDVDFAFRYRPNSVSQQPYSSTAVNPRDTKVHYKIKCDFEQRTARVDFSYTDGRGQLQEGTNTYKIIGDHDPKKICLVRVTYNGIVDVITMSGEIGSFIDTISYSQGIGYNGTSVIYGTCRN